MIPERAAKLGPTEITKLADLEPREVLLAKLAGAMKASLSGAAATFAALPTQMARLASALEAKRTAEGAGTAEGGAAADGGSTAEEAGPAEGGTADEGESAAE